MSDPSAPWYATLPSLLASAWRRVSAWNEDASPTAEERAEQESRLQEFIRQEAAESVARHRRQAEWQQTPEGKAHRAAFMAQMRKKRQDDPLWARAVDWYPYDESQLVTFLGAQLDDDVHPKMRRSPRTGWVGMAEFREIRQPVYAEMTIPFEVNRLGFKTKPGVFFVEYSELPLRIDNLKRLGIRPSQSEQALDELERQLQQLRRKAGLTAKLLTFPGREV